MISRHFSFSSYPVFFFLFYSWPDTWRDTVSRIVGRKTIPHILYETIPFFLSFGMLRLMSATKVDHGEESRPSFRSPTGRARPKRRSAQVQAWEHDAWHKAMCKRNIAIWWYPQTTREKKAENLDA